MNKPRCHFTGAEKVATLKRHLLEKFPFSDLGDELGLYPNQVYCWRSRTVRRNLSRP